ncbi:hypothetical protein J7L09_01685 [bacterium]|nr:hypothetical protein [bacterium]
MEHLKEKRIKRAIIVLYEYYCPSCDHFFWTIQPLDSLFCPYCMAEAYLNGEIPIKNIEINGQTVPSSKRR